MNYDDAFTLELVAEQLLDNFNFVAGIVPILTAHIKKVHARCITLYFESVILYSNQYRHCDESPPLLDPRSANLVQKALNNLSDFMSMANERESKNRQKLLRNLKVSHAIKLIHV